MLWESLGRGFLEQLIGVGNQVLREDGLLLLHTPLFRMQIQTYTEIELSGATSIE